MRFGLWILLFCAFIVYTWFVYAQCDTSCKAPHPSGKELAGWQLWQSRNCQVCHQLYGLGGFMGPDLTNTASERGKGARYMSGIIKYGTGRMPNFHLSDSEVNNLVSFLTWVDKSGKNRVPPEFVTWTGNYNISN